MQGEDEPRTYGNGISGLQRDVDRHEHEIEVLWTEVRSLHVDMNEKLGKLVTAVEVIRAKSAWPQAVVQALVILGAVAAMLFLHH